MKVLIKKTNCTCRAKKVEGHNPRKISDLCPLFKFVPATLETCKLAVSVAPEIVVFPTPNPKKLEITVTNIKYSTLFTLTLCRVGISTK